MNILIAPDSFKESASAIVVAEAIARGVRRALPDATLDICPMADGGQGTVAAMVAATCGQTRMADVIGPLGTPLRAEFGLLDKIPEESRESAESAGRFRAAVIEMAAASGLELVPPAKRDPLRTTTFGTGQLIVAALDLNVQRIIVGIGGSATNDCGAGMAQAIGFRFYDEAGQLLPPGIGGGQLGSVARIDAAGRDPRLDYVEVVVACDVSNPLTGPAGASHVYGPQKGATPKDVEILDANLARFAELIERTLGTRIAEMPGSGAAGGLGGGLVAFAGGKLMSGIELVIKATGLANRLARADLCITGEGRLDSQSLYGKTAVGVARLARSRNVPTIAIVGSAEESAIGRAKAECLDECFPIKPAEMPLAEAIRRVEQLLEETAERALRRWAGHV